MSLTVRNAQRVVFVLNLTHKVKVAEDSPYAPTLFSMVTTTEPRPGQEVGERLIEKKLPGSITWLPGETKTDLPEGITELDEFRRARAERKLVVIEGKEGERVPGDPKRYDATDASTTPSGDKA